MKKWVNPKPSGSFHIRPNWRFDLIKNPAKYKLQDFVNIPESGSSCLNRYISKGLYFEVNYVIPDYLNDYLSTLSLEEGNLLKQLWYQSFKRDNRRKINTDTDKALLKDNPIWNLKLVNNIQDEYVKKLIKHISNYEYNEHIQYALDLASSKEHQDIFRFIGYGLYAGLSDKQLAVRWRISFRKIEAIRNLFFDFSSFPKDRIANFTYLRQLHNLGLFDQIDFNYFRAIFALGELGIKAQIDYHNLSDSEKLRISEFLGSSSISNTLNLNFAVNSKKDAIEYVSVVSSLANYYIKEKEAGYFDAKTRNLDATTKRIEGGMLGKAEDMSSLDREMMDLLREYSLKETSQSDFKTLADLKK